MLIQDQEGSTVATWPDHVGSSYCCRCSWLMAPHEVHASNWGVPICQISKGVMISTWILVIGLPCSNAMAQCMLVLCRACTMNIALCTFIISAGDRIPRSRFILKVRVGPNFCQMLHRWVSRPCLFDINISKVITHWLLRMTNSLYLPDLWVESIKLKIQS